MDKVWKISKYEINSFLNDLEDGYLIEDHESILNWPGKDNPSFDLFELPEGKSLAPFNDLNGNTIYEPLLGEYPLIKGDEILWWIINDVGEHGYSGGVPIKMEIKCSAFGFNDELSNVINKTSFYEFDWTYFGDVFIDDFYFGLFTDVDLGEFQDDFVGCFPQKNMSTFYNGDAFDEGSGGYGDDIPMGAIKFLPTNNSMDNNQLSSFLFFQNNAGYTPYSNPTEPHHYYNYMKVFGKMVLRYVWLIWI